MKLSKEEVSRLAKSLMNTSNENGLPYFKGYESHIVDVIRKVEETILKRIQNDSKE